MIVDLGLTDNYTPYLKYNAKAGRWYVKEDDEDVELKDLQFAVDMASARSGWIAYIPGEGPRFVFDTADGRRPKPDPIGKIEFKRGFQLAVYSNVSRDELNGEPLGVREWSSTSRAARGAVARMLRDFEEGRAANPGKVPIFRFDGVTVNKTKNGDTFEPTLVLDSWVDRPADFDEFVKDEEMEPAPAPPRRENYQENSKLSAAESDFDDPVPNIMI